MPWITIITVVRNESKTLRDTVESVLSLTYGNLDYLIIDGGSTDGTVDIIRDYADRITWCESAPDNGIYDAMNKGWSRARDDSYIMFLGAGDRIISLPQHMGRYEPDEVIYGKVTIGTDVVFSPRSDYHLKFYNSLHHQALLINKNINPDPPFDVAFKHYADFDFNQRLFKAGAKFVFDETFRAFALPDGVTAKLNLKESLAVIFKNFGAVHAGVALTAFAALRCFPYLRKFRPYTKQKNLD